MIEENYGATPSSLRRLAPGQGSHIPDQGPRLPYLPPFVLTWAQSDVPRPRQDAHGSLELHH
jgi:hypothetical protein